MDWKDFAADKSLRRVVLVVDDEGAILRFARQVLEAHGYEVMTARNSVEALHQAAGFPGTIDVLLTDMEMRLFQNGMELAACFGVLRPETRVILSSGSALPDGGKHPEAGKVWSFLAKPYSPWQLLEAVQTAVGSESVSLDWAT